MTGPGTASASSAAYTGALWLGLRSRRKPTQSGRGRRSPRRLRRRWRSRRRAKETRLKRRGRRRRRRSPRSPLHLGLRVRSSSARWAMRSPNLVPQHLTEVKQRGLSEIDKVEREVRARLNREINYWDARAARLREEERAGKEQRINAQNAEATAARLVERLYRRQSELDRERQISALPPVLKGAALVIPGGLLRAKAAIAVAVKPTGFAEDPMLRAETERLAMEAVFAAERALG